MYNIWLRLCLFPLLILSGVASTAGQATFKGIVPFVTTRAEVEKMLGKPLGTTRYEFDDGRAYVLYRESICEKPNDSCFCLAAIDSVLMVTFQPYSDIKIEDLRLDPKIWRRVPLTREHVPGVELYVNEKLGITYEINGGFVNAIEFRESEETCQSLQKLKASKKERPN